MTAPSHIESPRDEAFRRIGRNIVLFQHLEALLKELVVLSRLEGTPDTIEKNHTKKAKHLRNKPLGEVASKFVRNVIDGERDNNEPVNPSEIYISLGFNLELDHKTAKKRRKQLQSLV